MKLAKLNDSDLLYVAVNMRDEDEREIFATRWSKNPSQLCDTIMSYGNFGWIAGSDEGEPIAAFGAMPTWNGVWQVWMFSTSRWKEVSYGVTKFIKRVMIPALEDSGLHRAECRSIEGHTTAHRWLESLGATREAECKHYGSNGEKFYIYCWTRPVKSSS